MQANIYKATVDDTSKIARIGRVAVELSHRDSCSAEDMKEFIDSHYNDEAILQELTNPNNIYHLICRDDEPAGFSKIMLNAEHPNIASPNTTKLDRIYLLSDYYGHNLGYQLLQHNIQLSRQHNQQGMWLFTWQNNHRAVNFYKRNGFDIIGEHKFRVTDTHYNPHFQMLLRY